MSLPDLIGWSRGGSIAATVARDLQTGVTFEGRTFRSDVRFVGLFDAVKKKYDVNAPGGWATRFSTNVKASYHLIHTYHDWCFDNPLETEDEMYPTVTTLGEPPIEYFSPNLVDPNQPRPSKHSEVGRDAKSLEMMVTAWAGTRSP